jgi:23S rRNA (uracil1939-C5)-methyltransferase
VQAALMQAGVNAEVLAPVIVPPRTRRRAVFKIKSLPEGLHIGFHGARSHTVIDMHQCEILTPGLFTLVGELRKRLEPVFNIGEAAELHVTQTGFNSEDWGFDAAFRWKRNLVPGLSAQLATALEGAKIARLTLNGEIVFETAVPAIALGDVTVRLPSNTFLQSTAEGERALQERVLKITAKAKSVADLFSGVGTFALAIARKSKVHAVEQDAPALAALAAAAKAASGLKPVTTEKRDLFKVPLTPLELNAYEAVVLDPPRAGAEVQARTLSKSKVPVIAYVSCDAATFARDAAMLIAGGYKIGAVTPIDQFLWSSHIELVAGFSRSRK